MNENERDTLAVSLKMLGFIDEAGNPTEQTFFILSALQTADLMDGYTEIYGQNDALELAHRLLEQYIADGNTDALRVLLKQLYLQSATPLPLFFPLLKTDKNLYTYCACLSDSMTALIGETDD